MSFVKDGWNQCQNRQLCGQRAKLVASIQLPANRRNPRVTMTHQLRSLLAPHMWCTFVCQYKIDIGSLSQPSWLLKPSLFLMAKFVRHGTTLVETPTQTWVIQSSLRISTNSCNNIARHFASTTFWGHIWYWSGSNLSQDGSFQLPLCTDYNQDGSALRRNFSIHVIYHTLTLKIIQFYK